VQRYKDVMGKDNIDFISLFTEKSVSVSNGRTPKNLHQGNFPMYVGAVRWSVGTGIQHQAQQ